VKSIWFDRKKDQPMLRLWQSSCRRWP